MIEFKFNEVEFFSRKLDDHLKLFDYIGLVGKMKADDSRKQDEHALGQFVDVEKSRSRISTCFNALAHLLFNHIRRIRERTYLFNYYFIRMIACLYVSEFLHI